MYPSGPKLGRTGLVGDSIACRPSSVISCAVLKAYKTSNSLTLINIIIKHITCHCILPSITSVPSSSWQYPKLHHTGKLLNCGWCHSQDHPVEVCSVEWLFTGWSDPPSSAAIWLTLTLSPNPTWTHDRVPLGHVCCVKIISTAKIHRNLAQQFAVCHENLFIERHRLSDYTARLRLQVTAV